jgi:hypothetical protein
MDIACFGQTLIQAVQPQQSFFAEYIFFMLYYLDILRPAAQLQPVPV